ncbi:uncharacterized protein LOC132929351 isoform X1 [Rhopalosiphum padi]|uniref:uncharacterized protein LOC132929351 isoform X1 n=1 Tax=Rhopalosiphum padi TaxID=40932 RepID=UPI00298DE946|nr:uncharacterized protein LOC132929351 isoform X1 [Rhopalosiphum padi]XP_060850642.1 uncharacterized protein LOC132929351 isoform X1 [Rhopalosiphum padi]
MAENIAFSDWSEKLDTAGTNHWLPAYGLQQPPVAIVGNGHQQNDPTFDSGPHDHTDYFDDNNEDDLCDNGEEDNWSSFNQSSYGGNIVSSTSYIFLETILEETSDDLRTDSERSSEEDFIKEENWSVINRGDPFNLFNSSNNNKQMPVRMLYDNNDPGVHDDDDDNNTVLFYRDNLQDHHLWTNGASGGPLTNGCGGGSLLQFESLEKQCEQTVFRTTATATPFMTNSAESLNTAQRPAGVPRRQNWKNQPTLDDDCGTSTAAAMDDDEAVLCSTPFSSYAGDGSSIKSLSKSMESVHSTASRKRCNNNCRDGVNDVSQSLDELRMCGRDDGQYDSAVAAVGATCAVSQPATGMYKTVDCLIDPAYCGKMDDDDDEDETDGKKQEDVIQGVGCKQQRSSENLSEDSGFGDQVPRGPAAQQTYKPIAEDENYFEMSTKSIVTIAAAAVSATAAQCSVAAKGKGTNDDDDDDADDEMKSKFSAAWHSYPELGDRPSVTTESPTTDDDENRRNHHHHHHHRDGTAMASRMPMSSTPNLCADGLLAHTDGDYLRSKKLLDSTVSLDRSHSLKRIHYESESALSAASSRGSNLLITTSFVNLATVPTPNKGVHFCPVVSEVNWRESFSSSSCTDVGGGGGAGEDDNGSDEPPETEDDDDYDRVSDEVDENIDTMVMKLLTGLPSETRRPSVAEKQQLRERLDFITGGSPPMSHRIVAAPTNNTAATGSNSHGRSVQPRPTEVDAPAVVVMSAKSKTIGDKLGGFFQRFSLRRLSGRRNKDKKKQKAEECNATAAVSAQSSNNNCRPDTPPPPPPVAGRPSSATAAATSDRGKKPPLPPQPPSADGYVTRRRLVYDENRGSRLPPPPALPTAGSRASLQSRSPAAVAMSRPDHRAGLLETDLDSNVTRTSSSSLMMGGGGCSPNKKARSLLDLGASSAKLSLAPNDSNRSSADGSSSNTTDYRAKSMEFLLDKENQAAVQAPENELRKVNVNSGERILSEHELRIQRSLQRLNLPEWYKTCNVPAQGFILKRHSDAGYTTSMSSLSSNQSQSPKMYSNYNNTLLSPQTHAATKNFSRWSTSRLNGSNSNSTSPCSSTRSSFNYRQPYLGWRSQEKLSKPRTPAERLAAGLLAQQQHEPTCQTSLSEVQSSIKEVTSAIANYVSSSTPDGSKERLNTDQDTPSRCPSFKGSTGRLCWLESSFVGNKRPSLTRDTPPSELTTPPSHRKATPVRQIQNNGSWVNVSGNASAAVAQSASAPPKKQHQAAGPHLPGVSAGAIRCRYSECQLTATVTEARRTFKMCHNCNHMYCSRRCRRAHWQNHRKTCLNRRTAALCPSIVDAIRANDRCAERLSTIARRGYLTHGRGAVKCYFSGVELADKFVRGGGDDMQCEPVYAKWTDIDPDLDALGQLCKTYNPDTRYVLHVSVCVLSEVPGPGPVQWERHVVYKCAKMHLDKSLRAAVTHPPPSASAEASGPAADDGTAGAPDTLILTSLPGRDRRDVRTARRVCFVNVQRHLRQRGVELRHQFPDVHQKLCEYVDGGPDVTFTPVTVYPRDRASGKTFMCIIMPDTEPEKLSLLPGDSATVQTIDIGREFAATDSRSQ